MTNNFICNRLQNFWETNVNKMGVKNYGKMRPHMFLNL